MYSSSGNFRDKNLSPEQVLYVVTHSRPPVFSHVIVCSRKNLHSCLLSAYDLKYDYAGGGMGAVMGLGVK